MRLTVLTAEDLRRALPMRDAIEVTRNAFARLAAGEAEAPLRLSVAAPEAGGTLLLKPARVGTTAIGAKLVSVFPDNAKTERPVVQGLVALLDARDGTPLALCDGAFLTAWRTGAASGAATELLARRDARIGALFGCGAQGRTQLLAICTARPLTEVRVHCRDADARERFVGEMASQVDARLVAAASPGEAVHGADVVCAATTSASPVFDGRELAPGAHVNGVGSYTPAMQELDAETVDRARVFVDTRESALAEAGDLIHAQLAARTSPKDWIELGQVARGAHPGRGADDEITLFKSVGIAIQDVATLAAAFDRARQAGLGSSVEL